LARVLEEDDRFDLLGRIAVNYPDAVAVGDLGIEDKDVLRATLSHLEEHGYVRVTWAASISGKHPVSVTATAQGYDFCERSDRLGE
jgi:hypothetical protein